MVQPRHPVLGPDPTLRDVQNYVQATIVYRGFDKESLQDKFIMLTEEVGELAKALRKQNGVKTATDSKVGAVDHEAADVLWLLICVCNKLGIDLEKALRSKEEINKTRTWQ
ncbi:MAG TPA: MazG nucleotide pyrophosphohydrolase domain-containing protein [Candidatus Saccharimonadales bacterium]|jgi:NTP pyrophosphatase (non-canonical NTP hydrolase)|nr:MazG nucleotide pyrophosphohydrolase domain-containing protein [Candidatus Saccharimonadales bacterium]